MTFEASNGMKVERDEDGGVWIDRGGASASLFMRDGTALALREYFRAEEDERLGLWRSTVDPEWTAKSHESGWVYFRNDMTDRAFSINKVDPERTTKRWTADLQEIARDYLAAHEPPKPGDEAKDGEYWELTFEGGHKGLFKRCAGVWTREGKKRKPLWPSAKITAAERIYPKEEA